MSETSLAELDDYEREEREFTHAQIGAQTTWANRRLKAGIAAWTEWLGKPPEYVVLWRRDYDRLMASKSIKLPEGIELRRGPIMPVDHPTPIRGMPHAS